MAKFGYESENYLIQAHPLLKKLFDEVVKEFDCAIICGYRDEKEQNIAFEKGYSKLKYPNSKHNKIPSLAVDVVPYPVDWSDYNRMYCFGGYVKGIAIMMGINIRWGGDWDSDFDFDDQNFNDLVHFELIF